MDLKRCIYILILYTYSYICIHIYRVHIVYIGAGLQKIKHTTQKSKILFALFRLFWNGKSFLFFYIYIYIYSTIYDCIILCCICHTCFVCARVYFCVCVCVIVFLFSSITFLFYICNLCFIFCHHLLVLFVVLL